MHRTRLIQLAWKALLLAVALWFAVAAGFAAQAWWRLPDLSPWHKVVLESEFHANRTDAPKTFTEYLALEQKLFAELKQRIYDTAANADTWDVGRYTPQSVVARLALDAPGNRSSEEYVPEPRAAPARCPGLSPQWPHAEVPCGRAPSDRRKSGRTARAQVRRAAGAAVRRTGN